MSIYSKDSPAERQSPPNNKDQLQRRDGSDRLVSRDQHAQEFYRDSPEHGRYGEGGMSMRPPLRPPSTGVAPPPHVPYAEGLPSRPPSQIPGSGSFPPDIRGAGPAYVEERPVSLDQVVSMRTQHDERPHHGSTPYAQDRRGLALDAHQTRPPRQPSVPQHNEAAQLHEMRPGPSAPPPMMTGLPQLSEKSQYKLIIRQQPKQGRLCGLGSKDKRPLDPLPILQLRILKEEGTEDEDAENSPNLVLQASVLKEDPTNQTFSESVLVESNDPLYPWTRMLEGRLVASANVARDLDGSRACFFVFTDLSIRQEGQFRLAFKLIALGPPNLSSGAGAPGASGQVLAEALTAPFSVYSPRRFPGMTESTELAKCLARQGIQVPVRNDIRRKQDHFDSQPLSTDDRDY